MSDRTQISTVPGEARRYQGLPAGLVTRVGANVVDLLVLAVALVVIYGGWAAVRLLIRGSEFRFPTPTFATVYVVGSLVFTVYLAASWAAAGRTYGAQVMGEQDARRRRSRPAPRAVQPPPTTCRCRRAWPWRA